MNGIYVQDGSGRIGSAQLSTDSAGGIDLFGMLESIPKREMATAKVSRMRECERMRCEGY